MTTPKPINVLLVGGPMDGQVVVCPAEATIASYWVYREPTPFAPKPEEYGSEDTMQVRYQIHPVIGQRQTWHVGRIQGLTFDESIDKIMENYHASKTVSE